MNKYQLLGESLLVDVEGGIATVTLDPAETSQRAFAELRTNLAIAVESLQLDDDVDVIIFTGSGDKAFSAGADLKEFEVAPLTPEEMGIESRFMRAFAALRKPTIAAINGYAVTGGFELVMNCNVLVASTHARFADTHVRVGVLPGWGLSQYLPGPLGPCARATSALPATTWTHRPRRNGAWCSKSWSPRNSCPLPQDGAGHPDL